MKKSLHLLAGLLLALPMSQPLRAQDAAAPEAVKSRPMIIPEGTNDAMVREAVKPAVEKILKDFLQQESALVPKRFAILPPPRDIGEGYVGDQFRNQFTKLAGPQGLELYTRMDAEWSDLLKEIKWGQDFGDTMDAATVQKFGRIQGVQALINTKIVAITSKENGGAKVELSAQVFEVETGRLLWGSDAIGESDGTISAMAPAELEKKYGRYLPWVGGGLGGLVLLFIILGMVRRAVGKASRPR